MLVPNALAALTELREEHERDDEIDAEEREKLAAIMSRADLDDNATPYSGDEEAQFTRVQKKFADVDKGSLRLLDSLDMFVKEQAAYEEGSPHIVGKSETIIDASYNTVAAYDFQNDSRYRSKSLFSSTSQVVKFNVVTRENEHSQILHREVDLLIPGFQPREFKGRIVWRKDGTDAIVNVSEPVANEQGGNGTGRVVAASVRTLMRFERLPPIGTVPQTKCIYFTQADIGGKVPVKAVNGAVLGQLMYLSKVRTFFDQSPEIDLEKRIDFVNMVEDDDEQDYSDKENELVEAGLVQLADFEADTKKQSVTSNSPQVTFELGHDLVNKLPLGRAKAIIRAPIRDILAYQWQTKSRAFRKVDTIEKSYFGDASNYHHRVE